MAAGKSSQIESDEAFWQSSDASAKRINAFDDSVDLHAAKTILSFQKIDYDSDGDDTINWDGSSAAASKIAFKSARYRPARSDDALPHSVGALQKTVSMPAADRSSSRAETSSSQPFHSPSIDDVVGSATRSQPTVAEMSKLEAEINFLKRSLDAAKRDNLKKVPTRDTVRKILMGQPYSLDKYKSKEDKLQLLDDAISSHDGNAIIIAVLFLRDTLKPTIFNVELQCRPRATEQYVNFLKQHYEIDKLMDILGMLARSGEAAMLKYKQAVSCRNIESKVKAVKICQQAHFQSCSSLSLESSLISEHIALMERQLPIEAGDVKDAEKGVVKFREVPRTASLLNMSVMTTLYYCCLYHYELPENNLASPLAIRKVHRLRDRQYTWIALNARARLRKWEEIERLFQTKGWLGGTKMKPIIPFDKVVILLHKKSAPREILNKYCNLIEPAEWRMEIGAKCGCHESVIDMLMNQRDRVQLSMYQKQLKADSQEWFYARKVLQDSSIKWKN